MLSLLKSMITDYRQASRDPPAPQRDDPALGDPGDTRRAPFFTYGIKLVKMSEELQNTFIQSRLDEETAEFLERARKRRPIAGSVSDMLNSTCLSRTSANAVTFRGGMFVLSKANAKRLLLGRDTDENALPMGSRPSSGRFDAAKPLGTLLDIGAGDGGVTANVAPMFSQVFATEASWPMQWRLWARGYTVINDIDEHAPYDCVALFNVLDRCDTPWSLLRDMKRWVKPDGKVIMAVVLPWCPFVEDGKKQKAPSETLPMSGALCADKAAFETCVQKLVDNVITPVGFKVESWTRVPYLCEGSSTHLYYALDDVVFVLRPVSA